MSMVRSKTLQKTDQAIKNRKSRTQTGKTKNTEKQYNEQHGPHTNKTGSTQVLTLHIIVDHFVTSN
jgi:hypothetical protein